MGLWTLTNDSLLMLKDITPPSSIHTECFMSEHVPDTDELTEQWLEKIRSHLCSNPQHEKNISWWAFFASLQHQIPKPPAITSLLPLFRDSAHTPAMVKHGMDVIKRVTYHVNQDQTPVMVVDEPLFAIAKKIQWKWLDLYGEKKFVILMGGLHIEMALLKVLGDWLDRNGWTCYLLQMLPQTPGLRVFFKDHMCLDVTGYIRPQLLPCIS